MSNFSQKLLNLILSMVIVLGISATSKAQDDPGETQYRFYVQDVDTREEAKLVHFALIEYPEISWCDYIHDCGCFKINTSLHLDREHFSGLLEDIGYELSGTLYCGDGRVLPEPVQTSEEK